MPYSLFSQRGPTGEQMGTCHHPAVTFFPEFDVLPDSPSLFSCDASFLALPAVILGAVLAWLPCTLTRCWTRYRRHAAAQRRRMSNTNRNNNNNNNNNNTRMSWTGESQQPRTPPNTPVFLSPRSSHAQDVAAVLGRVMSAEEQRLNESALQSIRVANLMTATTAVSEEEEPMPSAVSVADDIWQHDVVGLAVFNLFLCVSDLIAHLGNTLSYVFIDPFEEECVEGDDSSATMTRTTQTPSALAYNNSTGDEVRTHGVALGFQTGGGNPLLQDAAGQWIPMAVMSDRIDHYNYRLNTVYNEF